MPYKIIWSPTAKTTYFQILDYIANHWSSKEVISFIDRTEKVLAYIRKNPTQYPSSKIKKEVHQSVLTKHVSLYYQVNKQSVELFIFWDNRQDPAKFKI